MPIGNLGIFARLGKYRFGNLGIFVRLGKYRLPVLYKEGGKSLDCKHKFLKTVRKGALRKANKSAQIFVNIDNKLRVFLPLVIRQSVGHIVH
jgi:hypothetical protein